MRVVCCITLCIFLLCLAVYCLRVACVYAIVLIFVGCMCHIHHGFYFRSLAVFTIFGAHCEEFLLRSSM